MVPCSLSVQCCAEFGMREPSYFQCDYIGIDISTHGARAWAAQFVQSFQIGSQHTHHRFQGFLSLFVRSSNDNDLSQCAYRLNECMQWVLIRGEQNSIRQL